MAGTLTGVFTAGVAAPVSAGAPLVPAGSGATAVALAPGAPPPTAPPSP
ncbi:hypothetical protein [Streptomyces sp. LMG1-1-1.1]